jgi:nucleoside 2-deoxyribosyltransferase
MIRIYPASKLRHGPMWRALCDKTPAVQFHARWLKHNKIGTPDSSSEARQFWMQDVQDIKDADCVFIYAEPEDRLRGALVEAGIALALGIPVYVIGEHPDYGTWQHHPNVRKAASIKDAIEWATVRPGFVPRYMR